MEQLEGNNQQRKPFTLEDMKKMKQKLDELCPVPSLDHLKHIHAAYRLVNKWAVFNKYEDHLIIIYQLPRPISDYEKTILHDIRLVILSIENTEDGGQIVTLDKSKLI